MVRYIFKTRANWWRYKLWTNNDRNQLINMKYSGTHRVQGDPNNWRRTLKFFWKFLILNNQTTQIRFEVEKKFIKTQFKTFEVSYDVSSKRFK